MQATYWLKKPLFITIRRNAGTREEAITHVTCRSFRNGETQPMSGAAYKFCDRIVTANRDPVELACELVEMDIDAGVRDVYRAARTRAEDFIKALEMRDREEVAS